MRSGARQEFQHMAVGIPKVNASPSTVRRDLTLLEVDVVDRATGTVLWTRRVKSGADPRDRGDVARLLDEALADLPR